MCCDGNVVYIALGLVIIVLDMLFSMWDMENAGMVGSRGDPIVNLYIYVAGAIIE